MDAGSDTPSAPPAAAGADRMLAGGLVVLALALAVNTLLGPLVLDVVTYPFSGTLYNQTLGLEAVSLLVVAPWCLVAAALVRRGHGAGPLLALPPTGYAAYMFVQYVVGPQYTTYPGVLPLHLGIFVLGWVLLATAWRRVDAGGLPALSGHRRSLASAGLVLLAAFTAFRYLPAIGGVRSGAPLPAEFAGDPSMYWTIVLLDLGVVVPVTVAAAVGASNRLEPSVDGRLRISPDIVAAGSQKEDENGVGRGHR